MPASGKTPIQLYRSITAGVRPPSLVAGEVFINQADGVLSWPNAANAVQNTPLDNYVILASDFVNSTTTSANVFAFSAVANATYEIEWMAQWQGAATNVGLKGSLISPSGAAQTGIWRISGVLTGTTAPTNQILGTSGAVQNGPVATTANVSLTSEGTALVNVAATAGTIALQAAPSVVGTLTIKAGSFLRYRRIR